MPDLSYCESSFAGPLSKHHIRSLEGDERRPGGGIKAPALCGLDLFYGWDLEGLDPSELTSETLRPYVCSRCLEKAAELMESSS